MAKKRVETICKVWIPNPSTSITSFNIQRSPMLRTCKGCGNKVKDVYTLTLYRFTGRYSFHDTYELSCFNKLSLSKEILADIENCVKWYVSQDKLSPSQERSFQNIQGFLKFWDDVNK